MAFLASANGVFLRVAGFFMSIVLLFVVPPQKGTTIEAADESNLKLQFTVLSDVHVGLLHMVQNNGTGFAKTLRDIKGSKRPQDALVFVGDNTALGWGIDYCGFYGFLSHYKPAPAENTLVAMGNHDIDMGTHKRHNFFYQSYTGTAIDKPCYSKAVGGYTFIVLNDEKKSWDPDDQLLFEVGQAQLNWLDQTLSAAPAGKPVFVVFHYRMNDAMRAVVEQYPNVFVFNGHYHAPPDVQTTNGVHYVNVPAISQVDKERPGPGFQVEIYEDEVLLRARDYAGGEWLTGHVYPVALEDVL